MKLDCTTDKYEDLYARWLVDPGKLLDLAELKPGERVIDLCGGTGIVAREAVKRGARSAFVVDLNPIRVDFSSIDHGRSDYRLVPPIHGRAEEVDQLLQRHIDGLHDLPNIHTGEPTGCLNDVPLRVDSIGTCRCARFTPDFDLVVCRQAIGYLDVVKTARAVARVLKPGSRFVFNAFVKPKWALKSYKFDGKHFFEASGFFGRTVYHVQASPGIGVDVTRFRWHHEEYLDAALAPYFEVVKTRTEKSLYYVCTK